MRRTKEDAEKTRLKVIEAALALFSSNGYSRTTLAMIAAAAGFSRGPIYWHFTNKDELFAAVLSYSQLPLQQLAEQSLTSDQPPLAALEQFIHDWFLLLLDNPWHRQSFEILLNKTELTADMAATMNSELSLTRLLLQALAHHIGRGQQQGELSHDGSADSLALLLYTQLMGITHTWLLAPSLFELRQQLPLFSRRLLAGLRA